MLLQGLGHPPLIADKPLINLYNLLEIKFLEINIESPYKKINQIALLQFATPHTSKILKYIRHLLIELIETINRLHRLLISPQKPLIPSNRQQLRLKFFIRISSFTNIRNS